METITSNDFLTLLVTEMKNQDPTQPTDPNAYIQQLVGVNSLQQLIGINQELGDSSWDEQHDFGGERLYGDRDSAGQQLLNAGLDAGRRRSSARETKIFQGELRCPIFRLP